MTRNGIGKLAGASAIKSIAGRLRNATTIVVGPMPKRFEIRVVVKAAMREPTLPTENRIPITPGRQLHLAHEEDEEDREGDAEEEIRRRGAPGLSPEIRIPEDESQALLHLRPEAPFLLRGAPEPAAGSSRLRMRSRNVPDARKLNASTSTAYGAVRSSTSTPPSPGPASCAVERLISSFELPSPMSLAVDERRQVRLVGDVEEDGEDAGQERDRVQLPERQHVRGVRDRDRQQHREAPEVADDEDRLSRQAIDPDARGQREEDEREEVDRSVDRDLEGARVEHDDRDETEREIVDLRAELADRLRRPEVAEVAVAPEPARSSQPHVMPPLG